MHTIQDWLCLHEFEIGAIREVLLRAQAAQPSNLTQNDSVLNTRPHETNNYLSNRAACFDQLIQPSLASFFGSDVIQGELSAIEFKHIPKGERPHTIHSDGKSPIVATAWSNKPEDLVCLAHEVSHALQSNLSNGVFMPPVAREVCAFIGELVLLGWAKENTKELNDALNNVWLAENENYLRAGADDLLAALSDTTTTYTYNINYPLARIMAAHIFSSWTKQQIYDLFASGSEAMSLLPLGKIVGPMQNELPPFPDTDQPSLSAYRSLGAMVLLDLKCWNGETDTVIGEYYGALSKHLRQQTSFIGLQQDKRPIGYATWEQIPATEQEPHLQHLAAPFGDEKALKNMVHTHMKAQSAAPFAGARAE